MSMGANLGPWDRSRESFAEYNERKNRQEMRELALAALAFDRYTVAVEHGQLKDYDGRCTVHAYLLCNDCWQKPPGLVDPRALVMTGEILCWLVPQNEDLEVGARMADIVRAMIQHEDSSH